MIKLQVIGNLGKDCIVNSVNSKSVINFSVAHSEKYKDAQGMQKERTTWVECAYWTDKTAISPYLRKGTTVYVEGTPEVRQYTRNDGTGGATSSLRVSNIQLLGQKPENSGSTQGSNGENSYQSPQPGNYSSVASTNTISEPDDLPF